MHARSHAGWQTCPACRLPMPAERLVCATCGGIAPVENLTRYSLNRSGAAIRSVFARLFLHRSEYLLWVCALVPLLLLPPTLALVASVLRWPWTQNDHDRRKLVGVAAAAAINIVISVIVLAALSDTLFGFAAELAQSVLQRLYPAQRSPNLHYL